MTSLVFPLVQSFLLKIVNDNRVKELVIKLLEAYVAKTDNDIDDTIVAVVKTALIK